MIGGPRLPGTLLGVGWPWLDWLLPFTLPAFWAEEWRAGKSGRETCSAPAGGRRHCSGCLGRSQPGAFVRISIYSQKMNTDTVILYPFLFKGVIDAFYRIMDEGKKPFPLFCITGALAL